MEFDKTLDMRRTVREWADEDVPEQTMRGIVAAGLKASTNDHMRNWEFIALHTAQEKETALQFVKAWSTAQQENNIGAGLGTLPGRMYAYAMPRQYTMLSTVPWVVIPLFRGAGIFHASGLSALNGFASIWCAVENMFLAAAARGLACSMRIPVGDEGAQVASVLGVPGEYTMPCYIGIGRPSPDAPTIEQVDRRVQDVLHFGRWQEEK